MSKISMDGAAEEVAPVVQAEAVNSSAVVVRQNMTPSTYIADNDAEGEFSADDSIRGKLAIVAKTGELSNKFQSGSMLLNGEYVIGDMAKPLDVVAIAIKKVYQNDLKFGGEMGDSVAKAVQVLERGGIVGYRPDSEKDATHYWKPVLQVVFLIQKPEGLAADASALFPFVIEGKEYIEAGYWASSKSAYNGVAKVLIQAKLAKGTPRTTAYRLTTKGESNRDGSLSWIQALLRATGPTSPAILKFIEENHGG